MSKALIITNLEISNRLALANLDGINQAESLMLPGDKANSINWIAGHLLVSRNSILKLAGGEPYLDAGQYPFYARGSKRLLPGEECMDIDELRGGISETGKLAVKLLRAMPAENLEQHLEIPNFPVKFEEPTLEAHISLLIYHEGYHVGQLGLARCAIGKEPQIK